MTRVEETKVAFTNRAHVPFTQSPDDSAADSRPGPPLPLVLLLLVARGEGGGEAGGNGGIMLLRRAWKANAAALARPLDGCVRLVEGLELLPPRKRQVRPGRGAKLAPLTSITHAAPAPGPAPGPAPAAPASLSRLQSVGEAACAVGAASGW